MGDMGDKRCYPIEKPTESLSPMRGDIWGALGVMSPILCTQPLPFGLGSFATSHLHRPAHTAGITDRMVELLRSSLSAETIDQSPKLGG